MIAPKYILHNIYSVKYLKMRNGVPSKAQMYTQFNINNVNEKTHKLLASMGWVCLLLFAQFVHLRCYLFRTQSGVTFTVEFRTTVGFDCCQC